MTSTIDTSRYRQALEEERRRIVDALENLHDDHDMLLAGQAGEETAFDNHPGDVATVTFDRELDDTLEENSEQVLAAIDAALKRIDDGTYGTCVRCGKPIPEERLEAKPYASLCIDHQRELERG
jgi:RNA polymerase-binding protein DksA